MMTHLQNLNNSNRCLTNVYLALMQDMCLTQPRNVKAYGPILTLLLLFI